MSLVLSLFELGVDIDRRVSVLVDSVDLIFFMSLSSLFLYHGDFLLLERCRADLLFFDFEQLVEL